MNIYLVISNELNNFTSFVQKLSFIIEILFVIISYESCLGKFCVIVFGDPGCRFTSKRGLMIRLPVQKGSRL
jgi:hypothetical protein